MKKCSSCGLDKSLDDFYVRSRSKDGKQASCITCVKQRKPGWSKTYYEKNRERLLKEEREDRTNNLERERTRSRKYYQAHRESVLQKQRDKYKEDPTKANDRARKRRALKQGTSDSTLTEKEWLSILETFNYECVYCGDPWVERDHFIPLSKGGTHTADNVVPACMTCNRRKRDKMPLEFIGCGL